jgi:hypothetical protein
VKDREAGKIGKRRIYYVIVLAYPADRRVGVKP